MPLRKKLQRLGGSVALVLPKSVAETAGLHAGDEVAISVEGSTLVIRADGAGAVEFSSDDEFERAQRQVLERYGETFRLLSEFDRKRRR